MRFTRRSLDPRAYTALLALAGASLITSVTTSCSSSDDRPMSENDGGEGSADAASDGALEDDVVDAGTDDVALVDAALVDASPLPIACEAAPCALALSTPLPSGTGAREEGFCALLTDGTVACWGANNAGQLGIPDVAQSASAVRVPGLSDITHLDRTCAVDGDGAVWCWGRGPFLQSDASATTVQTSPVRLALPGPANKVAVSEWVGCAILRDASVVCWGTNATLQVSAVLSTSAANTQPHAIDLAASAKDIAVAYGASRGATFTTHEDGTLSSWGTAPTVGRPTPLTADGWPSPVALEHVTMVSTSGEEACAVANGVGWCWGAADARSTFDIPSAQLRGTPRAVDMPEPITRIATTQSYFVTNDYVTSVEKRRWCATTTSGDVYCWGLNNMGQAGDGTKEFALSAVRVQGLPAPAAEVKVMPYSTCALLTSGKVYCWGNNAHGQLGSTTPTLSVSVPREVVLP